MVESHQSFHIKPVKSATIRTLSGWRSETLKRRAKLAQPSNHPESLNQSIDAEITKLLNEVKLDKAPTIVFGTTNNAINWSSETWTPNEDQLARLYLFSGNIEQTQSSSNPRGALGIRPSWHIAMTRNYQAEFRSILDLEDPFYTFQSKWGNLWVDYHPSFRMGTMDLCVLESLPNNSVGLILAFKPTAQATQKRGDFKLLFRFEISTQEADKILQFMTKHPDTPYKLIQTLFQSAFKSTVNKEAIYEAWLKKGEDLLGSFDISHINYLSGRVLTATDKPVSIQGVISEATNQKGVILEDSLKYLKLGRLAQQETLAIIDLRGQTEITYSPNEGNSNTLGKATKILKLG